MTSISSEPILNPKPRDADRVARWVTEDGCAKGITFLAKTLFGQFTTSTIVFSAYEDNHHTMQRKLRLSEEDILAEFIIYPSGNIAVVGMDKLMMVASCSFPDKDFFLAAAEALGNEVPFIGRMMVRA